MHAAVDKRKNQSGSKLREITAVMVKISTPAIMRRPPCLFFLLRNEKTLNRDSTPQRRLPEPKIRLAPIFARIRELAIDIIPENAKTKPTASPATVPKSFVVNAYMAER